MKIITSPTVIFSILMFFAASFNSYAAPININTANASALADSLTGIGKYKAQAIIHYRQKNGLFQQPIDIVKVKGIGRATYNKNRTDILVQEQSF